MPTSSETPCRVGRVLRRMGRCVLTYLLLYAGAWLAVAWTVDWEEGFWGVMDFGARVFPFTGLPALLIGGFAVTVHRRVDPVRFRILLFLPLLLCNWLLLACDSPEPFLFQSAAHLAFVILVPAPLFPEDWLGETGSGA